MSKCPECKTEMKPLFNGEYCPLDCDRPEVLAKRRADALSKAADELSKNKVPVDPFGGFFINPGQWVYPPVSGTFNVNYAKIRKA